MSLLQIPAKYLMAKAAALNVALLVSSLGVVDSSAGGPALAFQSSPENVSVSNPVQLDKATSEAGFDHGKFSLYRYSRIPVSFGVSKDSPYRFTSSIEQEIFSNKSSDLSVMEVEVIPLPAGAVMDVSWAAAIFEFKNVGFPNIEKNKRPLDKQYKPYKRLVKVVTTKNGKTSVVPNVACHGYSAEKTQVKARKYEQKINTLSAKYKINPNLVKAVIAQESCFRAQAVSPVGARGLMQLMPETAEWLGVSDIGSSDQNLTAGIKYLSSLKRRFGSTELALAAYNAGPGNVNKYKGVPPFAETQHYVKKVMYNYQSYKATARISALSL